MISGFEVQIDDNARGDSSKDFYGIRPEPDGSSKNRTGAIYKIPAGIAHPVGSQLPIRRHSDGTAFVEIRNLAPSAVIVAVNHPKLTKGYRLPARYVIHAVGPVWTGGNNGEPAQLASCYRRCLEIADANRIAMIAFPSISTGIYGYPIELAANVAIDSVRTTMANLSSVYEVTCLLLFSK